MKKLLKKIIVEIYEEEINMSNGSNHITVYKNEIKKMLAETVSHKINNNEERFNKMRELLAKRNQEIENYFGGRLPHNMETKDGAN